MRSLNFSLLSSGVFLASVGLSAAVHAQTGPIEVPFSDLCLAAENGNAVTGANVVQDTCTGASDQEFAFNAVGDGFELEHAASGLCVQQAIGTRGRGANLTLDTCDQQPGTLFNSPSDADAITQLQLSHSGLCADVFRYRANPGTRLIQWTCKNPNLTTNQTFGLPKVTGAVGPIIASHSNKCLMPNAGGLLSGTPIVQSTCTGNENQDFLVERSGTNVRMRHVPSDLCINQRGRTDESGADFVLWNCDGQASQFGAIPAANGTVYLSPNHNDLCIDVYGRRTADGTPLIQWNCKTDLGASRTANQRFTVPGFGNGAGEWTDPMDMSIVAVAAAALPDGKVLAWSAYDRLRFGGDRGRTYTSIFDPVTGTSTETLVSNTGHDMFCPGISMLPDGDYLITGGSSANDATRYSPDTDTFSAAPDLILPRGYQSSTTLGNGDIFTVGGSWSGGRGNKYAEIFSVANDQWVPLQSVAAEPLSTDDQRGIYRADNHMWLFSAPDGGVFHAGPSAEMHFIDTNGTGSTTSAGFRGTLDAMNGAAAMYDIGKIFAAGGAVNYDSDSPGRADTWMIDINGGPRNVIVEQSFDLAYERTLHSSVVLPSGEVVVLGGQAIARLFTDDQATLVPEIWNPGTGRYSQHPPMAVPRTYHSTALLLKDGRVWAGGGGLCGNNCVNNHPDAEIFTPPYLVNADGSLKDRPVIGAAPEAATYGETIRVNADADVVDFVLIRLGSATHAVNTDQRRVPVSSENMGATSFDVSIPTNANIAPPGNYYLFAMSSEGVPSEAVTVNIQ